MNFFQLKLFSDLLVEKSFVRTAKLNHCTQPAVSMQIKLLEEEVGVRLFDRSKKSVEPTGAALNIEPIVQNIIDGCEKLKTVAKSWYGKPVGDLRVATVHSIGIYELSPHLKKFLKGFPLINLHLSYRTSEVIYDLLQQKKIDIGIVAYPRPSQQLKADEFQVDNMVIIAAPDHPFKRKKAIHPQDLQNERFIAFSPSTPTFQAIDHFLAEHNIFLKIAMHNENIDTLKNAVEIGLGVSIVPEKTIQNEVKNGTLISRPFKDISLIRPIGTIYNQQKSLSFAARCFLETLGVSDLPKAKVSSS